MCERRMSDNLHLSHTHNPHAPDLHNDRGITVCDVRLIIQRDRQLWSMYEYLCGTNPHTNHTNTVCTAT